MNNIDVYRFKRKSVKFLSGLVRLVFICCVSYLFIFPILYLLISAIQTPESMKNQSVIWIPTEITLQNFVKAGELMNFVQSAIITLIIAVFSTLATLISCSMAGYALARFNFFEKNIVFFIVLVLIVIPPQTTMMSTFLIYRFFDPFGMMSLLSPMMGENHINLINSPMTMIIPAFFTSGIRAGLMIFIFRQFFAGQPKELEEAAKIDGCGIWKTFSRVMLPLSVPAIITVAVFSFVWYWNDSFYGDLFFNGDLRPLTSQLNLFRNMFVSTGTNDIYTPQEQKAYLAAASILCILLPLILYVIIQKRFSESIDRVGIVG